MAASENLLESPFSALAWLDRWDRVASRSSMLVPSEARRERLASLLAERSSLMRDLHRLRQQLGV
jgi:hypothetical protein